MKKLFVVLLIVLLSGCSLKSVDQNVDIIQQNEEILNRLYLLEDTINEIKFRTEVTYRELGTDNLDYISSQLDKIYSEYDWIEDELEGMRQYVYYDDGHKDFTRIQVLEMFARIFEDIADFNDQEENWISFDSDTWIICEMYNEKVENCWSIYKELEYREQAYETN